MQTVTVTLNTAGDGYWSEAAKAVRIIGIDLNYVADDKEFGELCVFFNAADWDVDKDGLIYTDTQFKQELNAFLLAQGLTEADYSEQGMQGDSYVSCDVDGDFIRAWEAKYGYASYADVHVVD